MKKLFIIIAMAAVAIAAYAQMGAGQISKAWASDEANISSLVTMTGKLGEAAEPDNPHMSGKWLVLIDKNDEEHWYNMYPDPDSDFEDSYFLMLTLRLNPWNEDVPFYFMVDGIRYGAETEMQVPAYSDIGVMNQNHLYQDENRFCIQVNYTYTFGIFIDNEDIYMLIARSPNHDHSDSVESVLADQVRPADGNYYNLMGQPMGTEVPSVPGIYIHQGKKIVVR